MKQKFPLEIKKVFYDFLLGRIAVSDFGQWVYETYILETVLKPDDYLELISLDFDPKWKDPIRIEVFQIIKKYLDIEEYKNDMARDKLKEIENLLLDLLNRKGDLIAKIVEIYNLYCQGCRFLPWSLIIQGASFSNYLYELESPSDYIFPKSWTKTQIKVDIQQEIQRELPKLDLVISETLSLFQNGKIEIRIEVNCDFDMPYYDLYYTDEVRYRYQIRE